MADADTAAHAIDFDRPQVRLLGELNSIAATAFIEALDKLSTDSGTIVIEVTTQGGDAELGRRLALEVERFRKRNGQRVVFIGKTQCHSAGVTIMGAFPVRDRYLTRDCSLLIHSRQFEKTVKLTGPLLESLAQVEAIAAEIRVGAELETESFKALIVGSDIEIEEVRQKAPSNWYLSAEEALKRRLVAELV